MYQPKITRNIIFLCLIGISFLAAMVVPILLANKFLRPKLSFYITLIPILLPFIIIFVCVTVPIGLKGAFQRLPYVKYNPLFPIWFYYDPKPTDNRFDQVAKLKAVLQPYDVILRRYDYYIDGLILGQTSYFTHIAIYCGNNVVMDCIGSRGVGTSQLDDFAQCDDIAVVRFNPDLVNDSAWLLKPHKIDQTYFTEEALKVVSATDVLTKSLAGTVFDDKAPLTKVTNIIEEDINYIKSPNLQALGQQELIIFNYLNTALQQHPVVVAKPTVTNFLPNTLAIGNCYTGRQYDYDFNFTDEETLSCVEFVWDCYKALYPLHQIRRKITYYFGIVRTRVLVPDLFLNSEFFTLQYSSFPVDKLVSRRLYDLIQPRRTKFLWFTVKLFFWQLVILLLIWLAFFLFSKR